MLIADRVHDLFWRILEIIGEPLGASQRYALDSAITAAFDELIKAAQDAERERCLDAIKDLYHADAARSAIRALD
jgi:hypothetical protein